MKKKKAGLKIWLSGIFLTAILIWQIGVLIVGMMEAREIITLTAEGEEEIPREMLEQISSFPGYRGGYTQICAEGTLYVGDWSAPVTVWGVDLEEYPLDLWISTSLTSFLFSLSTMASSSNSLSMRSICSYFTPHAFKD